MNRILKENDREALQKLEEISSLIRCSLILLQADAANFKTSSSVIEKIFKKKPMAKGNQYFNALMSALIPEKTEIVISTIMRHLRNGNLWKAESVCCEIFQDVLSYQAVPEKVLDKSLDYIEELISRNNLIEARRVIRVLHSITSEESFSTMPDTGMTRLLSFYHSILEGKQEKMHFIRTGLECLLVKILRVISESEIEKLFPSFLQLTFQTNLSKLDIKDFGLTLINAIKRMRSQLIIQNIKPEFVRTLLSAMTLENDAKAFIATRYLTLIIDRFNNNERFSSPMIFHENTNYDIHLGLEEGDNHSIIEELRDQFENSIITNIKLHSSNRDNLNAIYNLICVLTVSLPNAFTIVSMICILMNLQTFLLAGGQNVNQTQANHLHSMIASLLTLVCWITRAKSLTSYVHEIVNLRFDSARHLNPPIMDLYEAANNKKDFFFDAWELRYCLWKRFRLNEERLPPVNLAIERPKPRKSQSLRRKKLSHERRVTFGVD